DGRNLCEWRRGAGRPAVGAGDAGLAGRVRAGAVAAAAVPAAAAEAPGLSRPSPGGAPDGSPGCSAAEPGDPRAIIEKPRRGAGVPAPRRGFTPPGGDPRGAPRSTRGAHP